jgi:hypothetical protein
MSVRLTVVMDSRSAQFPEPIYHVLTYVTVHLNCDARTDTQTKKKYRHER